MPLTCRTCGGTVRRSASGAWCHTDDDQAFVGGMLVTVTDPEHDHEAYPDVIDVDFKEQT